MMIRIRRLPPLFWIGLLPVVILLWAWADSQSHWTIWSRCRKWDEKITVTLAESSLHLIQQYVDGMPPTSYEVFAETSAWGRVTRGTPSAPGPAITGAPARWFTMPGDQTISDPQHIHGMDLGFAMIVRRRSLPLWVMLAGYLPLWLGISWWQARRRKKKIEREMPLPGS